MVPVIEPKRRPADMVKGIAGIARIWDKHISQGISKVAKKKIKSIHA